MEERVNRLEQSLADLQRENRELREQLAALRGEMNRSRVESATRQEVGGLLGLPWRDRAWARWSVIALVIALVGVPVLAFTFGHVSAFWSTVIGAVNGVVLYLVGPGAMRLLIEGLFRAIPAVLFGQAARVAVDTYRRKKAR